MLGGCAEQGNSGETGQADTKVIYTEEPKISDIDMTENADGGGDYIANENAGGEGNDIANENYESFTVMYGE